MVHQCGENAFAHRHNQDGTWDSICSKCFRIVDNSADESNMVEQENAHKCEGFSLARMFYSKQ